MCSQILMSNIWECPTAQPVLEVYDDIDINILEVK